MILRRVPPGRRTWLALVSPGLLGATQKWRSDVIKGEAGSDPHRLGCVPFQLPQRLEACFFSSVPSQPVPPLAQTLQGYLRALEPLLPPEELRHTRRMVQEFGRSGGLGPQLQEGLERRAMLTKNWVCVCVSVWQM